MGIKKKINIEDQLLEDLLTQISSDTMAKSKPPLGLEDATQIATSTSLDNQLLNDSLMDQDNKATQIAAQTSLIKAQDELNQTALITHGHSSELKSEELINDNNYSDQSTQVLETSDREVSNNSITHIKSENHEKNDEKVRPPPFAPKEFDNEPKSSGGDFGFSGLQISKTLKMAQARIIELESEIDKLREENDLLTLAARSAKQEAESYSQKIENLEKTYKESLEQTQLELNIYRDTIKSKDAQMHKLEQKIIDLESSIGRDIKKIRQRERELENRLELSKQDKFALIKSKDDMILDLKRKVDDLQLEIENYRSRYADANQKIDFQHGQLSRTVKALRLALAHLESQSDGGGASATLHTIKKAE